MLLKKKEKRGERREEREERREKRECQRKVSTPYPKSKQKKKEDIQKKKKKTLRHVLFPTNLLTFVLFVQYQNFG